MDSDEIRIALTKQALFPVHPSSPFVTGVVEGRSREILKRGKDGSHVPRIIQGQLVASVKMMLQERLIFSL